MGAAAVRFLIERIATPDATPTQELFAPPISLRNSTGPVRDR
jgi:DNA-binding LacI/PurR family transcriptional regulator